MSDLTADTNFTRFVFLKYSDMVLRIAYQNMKNQADAEDVTQDVFIKLIHNTDFKDEEHIKAWLIRVTINQCRNLVKSAWYRKTAPLTETWQAFTPEQSEVFEELFKLPVNQRNVIYLYFYENLSVPKIAKLLSKNESTVSSWLNRAKKKLKQIILEERVHDEK